MPRIVFCDASAAGRLLTGDAAEFRAVKLVRAASGLWSARTCGHSPKNFFNLLMRSRGQTDEETLKMPVALALRRKIGANPRNVTFSPECCIPTTNRPVSENSTRGQPVERNVDFAHSGVRGGPFSSIFRPEFLRTSTPFAREKHPGSLRNRGAWFSQTDVLCEQAAIRTCGPCRA